MVKYILFFFLLNVSTISIAQSINKIINVKEVERIESVLSSDAMEGRGIGTEGLQRAADFIAAEFKRIGLKPLKGSSTFKQEFTLLKPKQISINATVYGLLLDPKNISVITCQKDLILSNNSGYEIRTIKATDAFSAEVQRAFASKKNVLVWVDTSLSKNFSRLNSLKRQIFKSDNSVVFVLAPSPSSQFTITAQHEFTEVKMANVVGMLPAKTNTKDIVVFSGHYDHLGIGKPINGDSIYNGANDDAAGITAVIMLAAYYKTRKDLSRNLIFSAFTAEESGGYGSQYFSRQLNADDVVAMFNIEMIGTESKWGNNSAYITGYDVTDMGKILEKNLIGTDFKFYPDPYIEQNLFYRSDNATLARLGVPAHTISTSKMDSEANYHKLSDEIGTLNLVNMTEIIKALAISAKSIVTGTDAPTRVNTKMLR